MSTMIHKIRQYNGINRKAFTDILINVMSEAEVNIALEYLNKLGYDDHSVLSDKCEKNDIRYVYACNSGKIILSKHRRRTTPINKSVVDYDNFMEIKSCTYIQTMI